MIKVKIIVANVTGECIEVVALCPGDFAEIVVVRPWRNEQQAPLSTGFKLASIGLLVGSKTILKKKDNGIASLKRCAHYFFFTGTDTR